MKAAISANIQKPGVTGVTGVTASICAAFKVTPEVFSGVTGVTITGMASRVHHVTPPKKQGVTSNPSIGTGVTPVTPVTPQKVMSVTKRGGHD